MCGTAAGPFILGFNYDLKSDGLIVLKWLPLNKDYIAGTRKYHNVKQGTRGGHRRPCTAVGHVELANNPSNKMEGIV
jgi:hypothetical protein